MAALLEVLPPEGCYSAEEQPEEQLQEGGCSVGHLQEQLQEEDSLAALMEVLPWEEAFVEEVWPPTTPPNAGDMLTPYALLHRVACPP